MIILLHVHSTDLFPFPSQKENVLLSSHYCRLPGRQRSSWNSRGNCSESIIIKQWLNLQSLKTQGPTVPYFFEEITLVVSQRHSISREKAERHRLTWFDIYLKYAKCYLSGLPYYMPQLCQIIKGQLENEDKIIPVFYKRTFRGSLSSV